MLLAIVFALGPLTTQAADGNLKDILGDVEKALEKPTPTPTPTPRRTGDPLQSPASDFWPANLPQTPAKKNEASPQERAKQKKTAPAAARETAPKFSSKSTLVKASQIKTLPPHPSDTWLYGDFVAARTDGRILLLHPIFAGGFVRGYSTEVHVTFPDGVPEDIVRQLPQDPMYSTVGSHFPKEHPIYIREVRRDGGKILVVGTWL